MLKLQTYTNLYHVSMYVWMNIERERELQLKDRRAAEDSIGGRKMQTREISGDLDEPEMVESGRDGNL